MFTDHFFQKRVQPPPKSCFTHMDRHTYRLMVITLSVWYTALWVTTRLKMIPYATCRVPLRVSAPTMIPVCDHWNRGKTGFFVCPRRMDADTGANQYQTATAADNQASDEMFRFIILRSHFLAANRSATQNSETDPEFILSCKESCKRGQNKQVQKPIEQENTVAAPETCKSRHCMTNPQVVFARTENTSPLGGE